MENNHDRCERLNNFDLCMVHSRRLKHAMILREKPPYSLRKKNNNCLQLTAFAHEGKRKPYDFQ